MSQKKTPFASKYRYATYFIAGWALASNGPDMQPEAGLIDYVSSTTGGANLDSKKWLSHFDGNFVEYDPTNGTNSSGDILRVGP